jgi:hypothetical protein
MGKACSMNGEEEEEENFPYISVDVFWRTKV